MLEHRLRPPHWYGAGSDRTANQEAGRQRQNRLTINNVLLRDSTPGRGDFTQPGQAVDLVVAVTIGHVDIGSVTVAGDSGCFVRTGRALAINQAARRPLTFCLQAPRFIQKAIGVACGARPAGCTQ